jgi:aminomethyltransferase
MRTALYPFHIALGAKMIDFCGWEMPLQYSGMLQEHLQVRAHGGLFDLSHMGVIAVEGEEAEPFLDYLSTNVVAGKRPGQAVYTLFCTEKGTCLEDLIVYKQQQNRFFLVVNACNREKVFAHLNRFKDPYRVAVQNKFEELGIVSIQGPAVQVLIERLFPRLEPFNYMHFQETEWEGKRAIVSRTGYTGELGYEIFASNDLLPRVWEALVQEGIPLEITPAGLGARDTLRLEMGYALYGHEIDETLYPTESVASWAVKLSKGKFLGCEGVRAAAQVLQRVEQGVILQGQQIARAGAPVYFRGQPFGKVTSGGYSPMLQKAIALVLLEKKLDEGDSVEIQIRQHLVVAEVVKHPFYKKQTDEIRRDTRVD